MQNLKYHSINITAILVFSFVLASTINLIVEYKLSPEFTSTIARRQAEYRTTGAITKKPFEFYSSILDSGFFLIQNLVVTEANPEGENTEPVQVADISQLSLLGTITGSNPIARAMIRKQGEKMPGVFALRKIDEEISSDVYGYKLVWIGDTSVTLEANGEKTILEMYPEKAVTTQPTPGLLPARPGSAVAGAPIRTSISRAEIKQRAMNNLDEAMQGLVATPYRRNNVVEGFRLSRIPRANILYTLGARNGDIVRRINGRTMDSTEKLFQFWKELPNENRVMIDLERSGQLLTYEINITN